MILLYLTWLLNCVHHVSAYRYLPKNELPIYSYGAGNAQQKYVASLDYVPFHVLIVYNSLYCSGTLIRSKIVITAASCLLTDEIRRPVVKVGAESITANGQIIPVVEIKLHEYYRHINRIDNDIAMLVLQDDVYFNEHVKKAVIVEPEVALRTGVTVEVSGWGSSNLPQNYLNQLIWAEMIVMDKEDCANTFKHLLSPSNFCVRYQPTSVGTHLITNLLGLTAFNYISVNDRRLSDSGGPAMYDRDLLVGILSHGGTSNQEPYIAILTNVSYFHRWIVLNTKMFLEKYCVQRKDSSYSILSSEDGSLDLL